MQQITEVKISKLHGHKNYHIKIKDNKLVLIGENGSGKTTILRMIFYFLSKKWLKLAEIDFEEISLTLNGLDLTFNKKEFLKSYKMFEGLPNRYRHYLERADFNENSDIEYFSFRHGVPMNLIEDYKKEQKHTNKLNVALSKFDFQILYLPTYRRIEQDLSYIFDDMDSRDDYPSRTKKFERKPQNKKFLELIEFGMADIVKSIENKLITIREYSRESLTTLSMGYLGDVIDKNYNKINLHDIKNLTENEIKRVLDRIDETTLSKTRKDKIEKTIKIVKEQGFKENTEDKVVCYYFQKLLSFHSELESKEKELQNFCNVCNNYLTNKKFHYSKDIAVEIIPTHMDKKDFESYKISLEKSLGTLSSGEKQIVSIFSKIYLNEDEKETKGYLVLIDEPELSLSVPWQTKFLPDMEKGDYCNGLIAVTHSPFIYDSPEMFNSAHSLEEFRK